MPRHAPGTRIDPDWLPGAPRLEAPDDIDGVPWQLRACRIDGPWRIASALAGYEYAHADFITAVATPADGRFVVTAGRDGAVRCWEPVYGREVWTRFPIDSPVQALAVTPDGEHVYIGGDDAVVVALDPYSGDERWRANRDYPIAAITTARNGRVYVGGKDWFVRVLARGDGRELADIRVPSGTVSLAVVGERMFAAGFRGITMIDLESGRGVLRTDRECSAVAAFRDGLLAVAEGCDLVLRRVDDLVTLHDLRAHEEPLTALACTPHGRIATAGWDGHVRLWKPTTGEMLDECPAGGDGAVALACHRDGILLASGRRLDLWHADSGATPVSRRVHTGRIASMSFHDRWLATGSADHTVGIFDLAGTRPVAWADGFSGVVTAAAIDGRYCLAGTDTGLLRLIRIASSDSPGETKSVYEWVGDDDIGHIVIDDRRAFAATALDGRVLRLDATGTAHEITRLGQAPAALALSPDRETLAIADITGRVMTLPVSGGGSVVLAEGDGRPTGALGFDGDGRLLAAGDDACLRIYDRHGRAVSRTPLPTGFLPAAIRIGHDSQIQLGGRGSLATPSVPVWLTVDPTGSRVTAELRIDLARAGDRVEQVALIPDGRLLVATARTALLLLEPM